MKNVFCFVCWMMLTSGIIPIPCTAAADAVVQLPGNSKRPSKLSGAWARQAARKKVLEHVVLGHRVVQHKSPPLVGFTSLPVASLLSPATAAASTLMSMEATSPSPPFGKLSPPLARRSPRVEAQVVPVIQDHSWWCHLCTYIQDFVPGSRTCNRLARGVMYPLTSSLPPLPPVTESPAYVLSTSVSFTLDLPSCIINHFLFTCLHVNSCLSTLH